MYICFHQVRQPGISIVVHFDLHKVNGLTIQAEERQHLRRGRNAAAPIDSSTASNENKPVSSPMQCSDYHNTLNTLSWFYKAFKFIGVRGLYFSFDTPISSGKERYVGGVKTNPVLHNKKSFYATCLGEIFTETGFVEFELKHYSQVKEQVTIYLYIIMNACN